MLRVVPHKSAAAALKYYTEGLKREDYYSEQQEIVGKWFGKGAEILGISGDVDRDQFAALIENKHPVSGEKLTPRTKDNRRVGYDLNFHAPKSLSVLHAMTQDKEILTAFRNAVSETMIELEQRAETRVRKSGGKGNRLTGNLAWAEFVHFTSRPVGGKPDPHLHAHCFTFNATFDQVEERWKAAEFGAIKNEAHYGEAAFHARLSASLASLGYGIDRKKGGWEIKGMPASVIKKFSQRTAQIEKLAEEMGVKDAKAKDALGASSREAKQHGQTMDQLRAEWDQRLTTDEITEISKLFHDRGHVSAKLITPAEAMDFALSKNFERQSVAERGHILAAALRYGAGQLQPEQIKAEFEKRELIGRKIGDQHLCTTVDVLSEEIALMAFVRSGRNACMALGGRGRQIIPETLSGEQAAAVRHLLKSTDQVMAIRGGAGVGKTSLMKVAVPLIEAKGHKVFAFAPSASASRGTLRDEGFAEANTVAHLFLNEKLQKQVQGNVVWIDEAGLLGVRDLWHLMEIVGPNTRVILTGDAAQHGPVARGDAFRLLQKHAGLRIAEVMEIRRQEIEDYRKAIESLSSGDIRTGFRRLEALGAMIEIADETLRHQELAADYLALGRNGNFPLVVSPTHAESAKVTAAIRELRREAGQLGPERKFLQYQQLQWEDAERQLPENYRAGMTVQFNQNVKGITRGDMLKILGHDDKGQVRVQNSKGEIHNLNLKDSARFQVYEEKEIGISKGDRIRITKNGTSDNSKRLNNGDVLTVEGFNKKGQIKMTNGAVLPPNHGHLGYGYCQTSHSSQSKSVQDVLIAQSSYSGLASSREQFYVSCSRGKQTIRIYTDDRQELQRAVGNSSTRMAGVELAGLSAHDLDEFMSSELGAKQWRDAIQSRRGLDATKAFSEQIKSREGMEHPPHAEGVKSRTNSKGVVNFADWVKSRKGPDKSKTQAQNLDEHRKTEPRKTGEVIEWEGYIKARRERAGPDGKSRSKGHPSEPGKAQKARGRTVPKISQHSDDFIKNNAEAGKAKAADKKPESSAKKGPSSKKPNDLKEQLTKGWKTSADNFKKVAAKGRGKPPTPGARKEVRMGNAKFNPLHKNNAARAADHEINSRKTKSGKDQQKAAQQNKAKVVAPRPAGPKK